MRATVFAVLLAFPAYADGPFLMPEQSAPCATYADMSGVLSGRYGESVIERGLSQTGVLIEWWGNAETGTWTILSVTAEDVACIVQAGELFETLPVGDDA